MDSINAKQFDPSKADSAGPNPGRKVRVVTKVRGSAFQEGEAQAGSLRSVDWISVNKPPGESSEGIAISFRDHSSSRKESYWVDYCYGDNEENEIIYSRDVKPLISTVFEGHNSSIIAYGARGSGKTHVIQGSAKIPGLSVLAVAEFLSLAEQNGKSIAISLYEVDHLDHAVDLLNPEQPAISVLDDRGRIQFKGLSQIPVKSISEFQKAYFTACATRKAAMKKGMTMLVGPMGLMVYVFSDAKGAETGFVGKMNFVDLAGYEDGRKKSCDSSCLTETNKINKSIYALLNVCHALSTNESRVPYRESKLTRMLQDSMRGTSRILMVVCMNPSFCQDTIYMLSLVSRSCQVIRRVTVDATKKSESCSARQMMLTSHKGKAPKSVSSTAKQITGSKSHMREKKADAMTSAIKGRKLFDDASHYAKAEKARLSDTSSTVETSVQEEEKSIVIVNEALLPSSLDDSVLDARHQEELMDDSVSDARCKAELMMEKAAPEKTVDHQKEHAPDSGKYKKALSTDLVQEGHYMDKENDSFIANKNESPPISAQLRELSNNLKLLLSSTPISVKIPEQDCIMSLENQVSSADIVEPKTPVMEQTVGRRNVVNAKSPWEAYSARSSGMKNSLVQEYLRFLNTANKEELKRLKGIGEKRATYIVELREESPEPFKSLEDLQDIGLSAKQIKGMMKREVGELFN
ncbi:LOW QUALITY PROTEIN: kinesin-like protein KIN-10C [Neltuma alba]|uniref:LOW QUALITY PROTEIN: kinesin-like protein KIN-10C n=1 Tax=Neltuma alba TaxID=207710 RepID=UPI0010A4A1C4|nr:LOW QUALITY PROTEIN: kinesin-like protein KIN-10C [Prosopis alba]